MITTYEAGWSGFWLARWLVAQGGEVHVVQPSSVPENHPRTAQPTLPAIRKSLIIALASAPPWFFSGLANCLLGRPCRPVALGSHGCPYRPIGRRTSARPVAGRSSVEQGRRLRGKITKTDIELIALEIALVDSNARPNI